jgi:hypothetical protein
MTYTAPLPPPAAKQRPTTVTVATYLLFATAGMQVVSAIVSFATLSSFRDAWAKALEGVDGAEEAASLMSTTTTAAQVGTGVIAALIAVAYVLLGVFVGRGSNVARIITWVLAGLTACCNGFGVAGSASGRVGFTGTSGTGDINGRSADEIARAFEDALPGWYQPVTILVSVVALALAIAVIVLLVLPSSHPYFRKPEPVLWQPPGGYAQPGQPGYPSQPAYPVAQAQPGAPGQPPAAPERTPPSSSDQTDQWKPPSP